MKEIRSIRMLGVLLLVLGAVLFAGSAGLWAAEAPAKMALSNDDCAKCHTNPPADIAASGGKHKGVGCSGCHVGHPPSVKDNIPKCNKCHTGKPHYELKDCLGCHKNPHTPLKITFGSNVTEACLTCHKPQIKQLQENKSKHTALFCSTCHNVHGKKPACTQCHKPHSAEMTAADCGQCHKAHMPKVVTYGADVPNKLCGACHKKALDLLTANKVKHQTFACAFCHQNKHKTIPACQDCHGVPHPAGIMNKFPKCGECHKIAHDLNHWTAPEKQAAEKHAPEKHEAAKPAKKKK